LLELGVGSAPEVNPALVRHERIVKDEVVPTVIDIHAAPFEPVAHFAVAFEVVAGDERLA
jgi:hypothetical protein